MRATTRSLKILQVTLFWTASQGRRTSMCPIKTIPLTFWMTGEWPTTMASMLARWRYDNGTQLLSFRSGGILQVGSDPGREVSFRVQENVTNREVIEDGSHKARPDR